MTDLRALAGECFLLAVMGIAVFVPLDWWAIVPGIGAAYPEKIITGRPYQRKDDLGKKQTFPRTSMSRSGTRLRRSTSEISGAGWTQPTLPSELLIGAAFIFCR